MHLSHLVLTFQILYIVTAVGTMAVIIMQNRNPVKTIAWVLLLLFLPLIGIIIFYFFGEDSRRKRLISNKIYKKLNRTSKIYKTLIRHNTPPPKYAGLVNLAHKLQRSVLYPGNSVKIYSDGSKKFADLIDELQKAKHHIHFQYYIFSDDEIGCKIRDILISKAQQGVEVRVIYDYLGSWNVHQSFFKEMQQYGIIVQPFLKVTFKILTSRVNYRNHRKIVVVDGNVGFVGGMNIADRYLNSGGNKWCDFHIKIEGEAVTGLQIAFLVDWYSSSKELLLSEKYYPTHQSKGSNQIQFVTSGPMGRFHNILFCILQAISNAEKCIYIQTPYFIPNQGLLNALEMAAMRGVDVKLMIPKKSDTRFVHYVSASFLGSLLEASVSVYLYDNGFLHSKLMIIDDMLVVTGSANMDIRSFEYNFEIDAFIYDEETCFQSKNIFNQAITHSELLSFREWKSRSFLRRFVESVLRLFAPLF